MGKITFNGKDLTKPFDYNGKKVVKLTLNGKVLTLSAGGGGGTCSLPPADAHTYANGFAYTGTWPSGNSSDLTYFSTTTDTVFKSKMYSMSRAGIIGLWIQAEEISSSFLITTGIKIINAPNLKKSTNSFSQVQGIDETGVCLPVLEEASILFRFSDFKEVTSATFPKLKILGASSFEECKTVTRVDLPTVTTLGAGVFKNSTKLRTIRFENCTSIGLYSFWKVPFTELYMPKLDVVSIGSSSRSNPYFSLVNSRCHVTLPSKFNTTDWKEKLFGSKWTTMRFTWV